MSLFPLVLWAFVLWAYVLWAFVLWAFVLWAYVCAPAHTYVHIHTCTHNMYIHTHVYTYLFKPCTTNMYKAKCFSKCKQRRYIVYPTLINDKWFCRKLKAYRISFIEGQSYKLADLYNLISYWSIVILKSIALLCSLWCHKFCISAWKGWNQHNRFEKRLSIVTLKKPLAYTMAGSLKRAG